MLLLASLALIVMVATLCSLLPANHWCIRATDFPRLQILSLGLLVWLLLLIAPSAEWSTMRLLLVIGLALALLYQLKMVLPYTFLWPKQVLSVAKQGQQAQQMLSMVVANVLMSNRDYQRLIDQVISLKPDLLLTLESDMHWQQALAPLEQDYPYSVKVPLDNLYGMHLYSRLPLSQTEVKFLLSAETPSIHAQVRLPSGHRVQLYCLHPKPPSPTEAKDSTLRDAELLMVAKQIPQQPHSCIVMGDLNDVAWSRTTRLFQRISGLLDPRVGRYFVNTFHAQYPFLRWSLDHVFHSADLALVEMYRLPDIGSDHFAVYSVLQYVGDHAANQQQSLEHSAADRQLAEDKIQEGREQANTEDSSTEDQ